MYSTLQSIGYLICRVVGTSFSVIMETEEQVEISFTRTWNPSLTGKQSPLNIDKRYIMLFFHRFRDNCNMTIRVALISGNFLFLIFLKELHRFLTTHLDWSGGIGLRSRSVLLLEVSSSILPDANLGGSM